MEIKVLNDLYSDENTYFIIKNGEAIIIDPGCPFDKIKDFSENIKIKYIFLTHCHYDHISTVNDIINLTGAKVCCSKECSEHIKNINISLTKMGLGIPYVIENTDIIFDDGEKFIFNGETIKIIKTPGHTSCSVCYMINNNLFSGDTLFFQNVGRWDLPTGNGANLTSSVKEKLYILPDETIVYPGHGRKTSIGYEKKYNMYIKF